MEINQEVLAELVASKLADDHDFERRVADTLRLIMDKKVQEAVQSVGNGVISQALEKLNTSLGEFKLRRTNNWGEAQGPEVTIPQWCEEEIISKAKSQYNGSEISKKVSEIVSQQVKAEVDGIIKQHREAITKLVTDQIAAQIVAKVKT